MATGEPFEGEARVPRADGQYRWLLVRAVPLRDQTGRIVHWYATGIDIEDRKRAETALQRSEAYLAEAQRLSRTGSFGWNVADGALYWSKETFSILGYAEGTTPTLDLVFQRVHPEDLSAVQEAVARASDGGNELELEHPDRGRDRRSRKKLLQGKRPNGQSWRRALIFDFRARPYG
jgi:PAS domain-containing protein